MASEGKRAPDNEGGIKLSADVKPFVPKYAVLNVAWSESSDACVFPNFATTCYPFVQELPVTEQKAYTEDVSLGSSPFSSQYSSPDIAVDHQCTSYSSVSTQSVCSVPGSQYDYNHPKCYNNVRIVKSRNEQICSLPQETKSLFKKRTTFDEQKLNNKGTEGNSSSDIKSAKGPHQISTHTEGGSKSDIYHKRADRKPKTSRKNVPSSKPEFELKLLDFPKLQGSENSDIPELQKQPKWGPLSSTASDISLIREVVKPTLSKEDLVVKAETTASEPDTNPPSSTRELSWTPMGYVVRPTTTETPTLKNVTSLVNTKKNGSSVTPKKVTTSFSSPEVLTTNAYNKEKQIARDPKKTKNNNVGESDQEEMRKNKKKKKKPKANYETLTVQEPPRIEDIEEFPNLAVASERKNKVDPSKCLSKHQPEDSEELVNRTLTSDRRNGPQSSKFHSKQQPETTTKKFGKKSQIPVKLDLGGMLAALEKKQHSQNSKQSSKPVVVSVGAVPVLSKELATSVKNHRLNQVMSPHNPLDSSSPLIKKGKQREVPKAKKPTSLKKIILKEREERKQKHLLEQLSVPAFAQRTEQDLANNVNSQSSDHVARPDFEQIEEKEDSVPDSSTVEVENTSEEPLDSHELQQDAEVSPIVTQPVSPLPKIHSRRFRDYCSQMLSKEVDDCVMDLLKELVRFQDRMYQKDPVKAKTKRRLVMGLREVLKHLKLRKLKCVIISPNCEKSKSKGGLDETLHTIINYACEQNVPFVFALNRKALGRSVNKVVPVSVVGIFSYDGAQDQFHKMIELTMEARQAYKVMLSTLKEENEALEMENPISPLLTPQSESCSSEHSKTADKTKEEEPNYIKIWKKNLEEYSPYALELEQTSTTEMLNLNL
ncbi:selenocysteine insertion sequence-binding protein 2 [Dromiciops gliroides]|uniref:selenocysteine insertion sequence-binding protein 2 n=1 Tax=Dromiciops gliroides TaxID=33562 RepID=UPI001CC5B85F|nr:selenocysteine insertion sequence-binding protein 2 [Dromiciops gliroides]XP_043828855.1 selenocysteine insertion sequence-binding protein 2 [Dromiciops gliroides]XP_043828861.1 selenocysteine insertion sequence-binding protein 2 [Dromiciops gliroides]